MKKLMLPPVKAFIAVEVIYQGEVDERFDEVLRCLAKRPPDARGKTRGVDRDQSWYFDMDEEGAAKNLARLVKVQIKTRGRCRTRFVRKRQRRRLRSYKVTMKIFGDQPVPPEPASTPTEHLG